MCTLSVLFLAEYPCDGQILHENNSEANGWTFGSACGGKWSLSVGTYLLNPLWNSYLVALEFQNCSSSFDLK
jgi:hypothetical protein